MKPSDVYLWRGLLPLIDTFGRAELEMAAACIVRTCVQNGDVWQWVILPMMGAALGEDLKNDKRWQELNRNPFTPQPDVRGLVKAGFAECDGDIDAVPCGPVRFTEAGLAVLRKCVPSGVPGPTTAHAPPES